MPSLPPPRILPGPHPRPSGLLKFPGVAVRVGCALDLTTCPEGLCRPRNRVDKEVRKAMSEGQVICPDVLEIHRFFLFHQLL